MENKKLKQEIKDLKDVIIQLTLALFKTKNFDQDRALNLLADAVARKEKNLSDQIEDHTRKNWRL